MFSQNACNIFIKAMQICDHLQVPELFLNSNVHSSLLWWGTKPDKSKVFLSSVSKVDMSDTEPPMTVSQSEAPLSAVQTTAIPSMANQHDKEKQLPTRHGLTLSPLYIWHEISHYSVFILGRAWGH